MAGGARSAFQQGSTPLHDSQSVFRKSAGTATCSSITRPPLYIYAMHDFNRLMSAMSIDGIWQNNLIYFEIRQNAASLFGIRIRIHAG